MKEVRNSKEKTLASTRYFIYQLWGFKYLVMAFGILIEQKSVLKLVEFLVSQNTDIISYLDRAFNSDWKTCITF